MQYYSLIFSFCLILVSQVVRSDDEVVPAKVKETVQYESQNDGTIDTMKGHINSAMDTTTGMASDLLENLNLFASNNEERLSTRQTGNEKPQKKPGKIATLIQSGKDRLTALKNHERVQKWVQATKDKTQQLNQRLRRTKSKKGDAAAPEPAKPAAAP